MRYSMPRIPGWVCASLLIALGHVATALADEPRLDPNVAPTFEAVTLALDADQQDYTGSVRIELRVENPTTEFLFHAEEMTLDRVELSGPGGPVSVEIADGGDLGTRRAVTSAELAPGNYTLSIDFSKPYNTKSVGLYRVVYEGRGYLFTQFENMDARKAFPCWDEPIFKIPFQLTVTVPTQQEAVSNTPVEKETVGASTRTLLFRKTPPTSTYLIAIAAGPIESVPITGMRFPGRVYAPKGQKHLGKYAASITPAIVDALEAYFGTPYPYEKLDLIAVPEFWPGAMENVGAITYRDDYLLLDPKTTSAKLKQRLGYVTAHEIAHMWFGDYVTMAWWDDLWLNESFADWLSEKIARQLYPDSNVETDFLAEVNGVMTMDARASTTPVRREIKTGAEINEDILLKYEKGRTILRMTEAFIGAEAFQRGVRDYLKAHAWGNAEAADLFSALSRAADKDIEPIMASFLDLPGYPLVRVDVAGKGVLRLSQKRFLNYGAKAADATWTVPVRLKISDGKNVQTRTVLLDKETRNVEVGHDVAWVLPDEGGVGYYRWVVPIDMMVELASDPTGNLTVPERARFLGNARALLDAGEISGDEYLAVAASFANTPEPEIVSAVINDLSSLKLPFITDELAEPYAHYVHRVLRPARDRYGIEPRPDDSEVVAALRPGLIAMLGREAHDEEVIAYCKQAAQQYLDDPASIEASIAGTVLGIAVMEGTQAQFDDLRARYESCKVPVQKGHYLSALGRFRDPKIQDQALAYALSSKVEPMEMWQCIGGIGATEQGREKLYAWMNENYDAMAARVPPEIQAYYPYFASGCSEQRLAAARKFFAEPAHRVEGTEANLAKVSDQVADCTNLREREGQAVAAYLRNLSAP